MEGVFIHVEKKRKKYILHHKYVYFLIMWTFRLTYNVYFGFCGTLGCALWTFKENGTPEKTSVWGKHRLRWARLKDSHIETKPGREGWVGKHCAGQGVI